MAYPSGQDARKAAPACSLRTQQNKDRMVLCRWQKRQKRQNLDTTVGRRRELLPSRIHHERQAQSFCHTTPTCPPRAPRQNNRQRQRNGKGLTLPGVAAYTTFVALVAQLDRALASGAKGPAFESRRARHQENKGLDVSHPDPFCVCPKTRLSDWKDEKREERRSGRGEGGNPFAKGFSAFPPAPPIHLPETFATGGKQRPQRRLCCTRHQNAPPSQRNGPANMEHVRFEPFCISSQPACPVTETAWCFRSVLTGRHGAPARVLPFSMTTHSPRDRYNQHRHPHQGREPVETSSPRVKKLGPGNVRHALWEDIFSASEEAGRHHHACPV